MITPCGGPINVSSCPQKIEVECICNLAENPCVSDIRDFLRSVSPTQEVTVYTNSTPSSQGDNTGYVDTVNEGTVIITISKGNNTGQQAIISLCKINEVVLEKTSTI